MFKTLPDMYLADQNQNSGHRCSCDWNLPLWELAGVEELWIDFGVGKNRRYYPIHDITATLGEMKCKALNFFHAFTGCDQVSFFSQCGKTKAWKAWSGLPEITEIFVTLGSKPSVDDVTKSMPLIEKFVTNINVQIHNNL